MVYAWFPRSDQHRKIVIKMDRMDIVDLSAMTRDLVDVAMGREPADLVIRNGRWVCVQSGEIIPNSDIAVKAERVAYVGPEAGHTIGESTTVLDAHDRYLVPGLLDAHMHVESGMLTVTEFVRAVLPHGTTGMFVEAANQPVHVWVQMPSCVPSAPGLETPGAGIGPEEVAEAMAWGGIVGLGEMMNFPGVIQSDEKMHAEMAATRKAGKVIGGHYASPDLGLPFHGYAAGGAEDDHEGTRMEDAIARARQGMKPMLRLGSAWFDVAEQVRALTECRLDPRHFILCTDDSHSGTLVSEGHMDRVVRHAIAQGLRPMTAIQMATLNTAEHFGVSRQVGMIAPRRYADILLVGDLPGFRVEHVIAKGQIVAQGGRILVDLPEFAYPEWAVNSIHLGRTLAAEDFRLPITPKPGESAGSFTANVIGVIENQAPTRHLRMDVANQDGEVKADFERDIAKIALVERHKGTGSLQVGLVHGFGFNVHCAVGSTVVHDSHQMIVAGMDDSDMALAVRELAKMGGGQVVVKEGEVIGAVELPIAGLMSNEQAEVVARKAESVLQGFRACGCTLNNPNMQLSLLGLVVIPELRLSDLGLVDVTRFEFIPVLENQDHGRVTS
jgi:adenine deaminase